MIDKDLISKVTIIFEEFEKGNSKIWNIDTDFINTYNRFFSLIRKEIGSDNFTYSDLEIKAVPHPKKRKW